MPVGFIIIGVLAATIAVLAAVIAVGSAFVAWRRQDRVLRRMRAETVARTAAHRTPARD